MKKLWQFRGGLKLPGFKSMSADAQIRDVPLAECIVLPLQQHIGQYAEPVVAVGDYVFKGQLLAEANGFVSAAVHASTSGEVIDISPQSIPHTSNMKEPCITIRPDNEDTWDPDIQPNTRPNDLDGGKLRELIRHAGIVGLGGAVFPSAVKLKPTRIIDTLVINGVECEPYISCDDALMRTHSEDILRGCLTVKRIINAPECIIAIEDNKPAAVESMQQALERFTQAEVPDVKSISIVAVPTKFPAGGEKQLIKVLTGREVPQSGLPFEVGVVCINVGTTYAIYEAVYHNRPLTSRIVTVTGDAVKCPGNYKVPLGTPVRHLMQIAGVDTAANDTFIIGGPMMGQQLSNPDVPVVKAANCILVNAPKEISKPVMPCIRCASCAQTCPMGLLPQQLYWFSRSKQLDKMEQYHLADCIECGCCNAVCPSNIPLVHYFRFAKSEIKRQEFNEKMASQSRVRIEAREARLERIKQEQEARKAARRAARQKKKRATDNSAEKPAVSEKESSPPTQATG